MRIGIEAAVGVVDLGDAAEMLVGEAVAPLVLVAEVAEGARPDVFGILELATLPGGGAEILGCGIAGHVPHHLDADDAGEVVAPGLDLGGAGKRGDRT